METFALWALLVRTRDTYYYWRFTVPQCHVTFSDEATW